MESLNATNTTRKSDKRQGMPKVKTELIPREYKSEYKILHGFWMQGDFFILVTHDITNNRYYLELFQYDSYEQEDKFLLFQTRDNVSFNI